MTKYRRTIRRAVAARRPAVIALLAVLLGFIAFPAGASHDPQVGDRAIPGGTFCDGFGSPAQAEGGASQRQIHVDVFIPNYRAECTDPNATVTVNVVAENAYYQGLLNRTVDFAVTDVPLSPAQKALIENDFTFLGGRGRKAEVHHIPLYIDSVAVGYNLPTECISSAQRLRLSSRVLSQIFSGTIRVWNNPDIFAENTAIPSMLGCDLPIALVKRTGFASSTYNFKDYLSRRNPEWNHYKQSDQNTSWPIAASFACEGLDEEGSAACITAEVGALGYIHYAEAVRNAVRMAAVENLQRQFEVPSPAKCQEAAAFVVTTSALEQFDILLIFPFGTGGDWSTVSLTDPIQGYPICHLAYALVGHSHLAFFGNENPPTTYRTIVDYLNSSVGLSRNPAMHFKLTSKGYTPLPPNMVDVADEGIDGLRYYP